MNKTSANFRVGTLKGKIRAATGALAFFIAFAGLAVYFINSLTENSFYAVFLPFLFLALTVIFFGRWLANDTIAPLEKVSLLAKSFERGVSTSLPKTTGSVETDELLESVVRLNFQIQKLIFSMDEVAAGNLDVALSPNTASDRIIQTFQKLLAKVSESIHAKQDLEALRASLARISEEIAPLKLGNLETQIAVESDETKEIALVLNFLTEQFGEIVLQTKTGGSQARALAGETQKTLQTIIRLDETRVRKMTQASVTLKQVPHTMWKILAEISQSSASASRSIEKAQNGTETAQKNLNAVGTLRHQIREAVKHVQRLNERSQEISKIAQTIEDLAQRTTMVALNASVQANELGEQGRGFIVVSEEVERLATRTGNMHRHISSLNKNFQAEIGEMENALNATAQEAANLSKFAIETGSAMSELEKYVGGFLNLQNKIADYSSEQSDETEMAFQVFVRGISETENSLAGLKETAESVSKISAAIEDLQSHAADFKVSTATEPNAASSYPSQPPPEENIIRLEP